MHSCRISSAHGRSCPSYDRDLGSRLYRSLHDDTIVKFDVPEVRRRTRPACPVDSVDGVEWVGSAQTAESWLSITVNNGSAGTPIRMHPADKQGPWLIMWALRELRGFW